jgi:hypothetical protein
VIPGVRQMFQEISGMFNDGSKVLHVSESNQQPLQYRSSPVAASFSPFAGSHLKSAALNDFLALTCRKLIR